MDEAAPQAAAGTSEGIASAEGTEWRRPTRAGGNEACGVVGMALTDGTDQAQDELKPWDEAALKTLRWHWGEAYRIGHDDEHGCWAARRDQIGGLLTGAGPDELEREIIADYVLKPVPRELPADRDPAGGALILGADRGALLSGSADA
jgi:hypothetical protein